MKIPLLLVLAVLLSRTSAALGQISVNASGTYTQNFDLLPLSGTSNVWADNSTLSGWYADKVVGGDVIIIAAGTGSSATTNLYSFGSASSAERALGALSTSTSGTFAYGVVFQNTSVLDMLFTDFSYRGELWRMGSPAEAETLEFAYRIDSTPITSALAGTWTEVNALDFTNANPAAPSGGTGAIDGNLTGNFVNLSTTLNVSVAAGNYVMFRWYDIDHSGADNGLAIDNLSISYVTTPPVITAVPESSTYGIVAAMILGCGAILRRHRSIRRVCR